MQHRVGAKTLQVWLLVEVPGVTFVSLIATTAIKRTVSMSRVQSSAIDLYLVITCSSITEVMVVLTHSTLRTRSLDHEQDQQTAHD